MRTSMLWFIWLILPVFGLAYHYGPGQLWLARDQAATVIRQAHAQAVAADQAQEAAYQKQLQLLQARRDAFLSDVDWQTQPKHPLAVAVRSAMEQQTVAYESAAEKWNATAELYGEATETLITAIENRTANDAPLADADRQLLESLRWAEARAMVRGGLVFNGIDQLQALLELRLAEAQQRQTMVVRTTSATAGKRSAPASTASDGTKSDGEVALPTEAIREELAAAQYVGARLLREEGQAPEVWRPVANEARQHYRFLADHADAAVPASGVPEQGSDTASAPKALAATPSAGATPSAAADLTRAQAVQRNLEQVLNLEQSSSDQLEGIPLPRRAPLARRPGDGKPGDRPGKAPGRGPMPDGPPSKGAGVPAPYGAGW